MDVPIASVKKVLPRFGVAPAAAAPRERRERRAAGAFGASVRAAGAFALWLERVLIDAAIVAHRRFDKQIGCRLLQIDVLTEALVVADRRIDSSDGGDGCFR